MVSVGFLKVSQTVTELLFLRAKLPWSLRAAAVIPRPVVLDCQMTEPEPLRRRRLPSDRNSNKPPASTEAPGPPAFQMGRPEKVTAAM